MATTSCEFVEFWDDLRPPLPAEERPAPRPTLGLLVKKMLLGRGAFVPFERVALLDENDEAVVPSSSTEIVPHPDSRKDDVVLVKAKFLNNTEKPHSVQAVGAYSNTGEQTYKKPLPTVMHLAIGDTFDVTIMLQFPFAV